MKLFQSLLVAPAAIGFLSPISVNASEVILNEISNYSDVESIEFANSFNNKESNIKPLLAGGEGLINDFGHDGSFSETTTASFSAEMYLGSVDGGTAATNNPVMAGYGFQIDLNSSFTGEDSLDISLDAGNAGTASIVEFGGNSSGDTLTVDGVSYSFPIGDSLTVMVGDNTDGSALFTTACAYGGPSDTLDDCGNVNAGITNGGYMAGAAYDFGNGFTVAAGIAGDEASVGTDEGKDDYAVNAAYTGDNYGVSLTVAAVESDDSATNISSYKDKYTALNAYYSFDFASISAGYEIGDDGSAVPNLTEDGLTSYFIGVSIDEVGAGSAGFAMGTKTPTVEDTDDQLMYEAYYSYPINDGMTITPLVYTKEVSTSGVDDETGVMVKTSFSF